jgi:segregation and condensation protein A
VSYEINLPLFQGPFDLLLFFIERDELDIYDIPIFKITSEFVEYLHKLEQMNLEVASEFILVAATLMRIKAKMLLPRKELDAQGNEIDPREELVRHLLEYKRFKAAADILQSLEESQQGKHARGNTTEELRQIAANHGTEEILEQIDLYKLLRTYQKLIARYEIRQNKPTHKVVQYPYTIDDKKNYLLAKVAGRDAIPFTELLEEDPSRMATIFNFLAILELVQLELLSLTIGEGFNQFWISKRTTVAA